MKKKKHLKIPQNVTEKNLDFAACRNAFYSVMRCRIVQMLADRWMKPTGTAVAIRQKTLALRPNFGKDKGVCRVLGQCSFTMPPV